MGRAMARFINTKGESKKGRVQAGSQTQFERRIARKGEGFRLGIDMKDQKIIDRQSRPSGEEFTRNKSRLADKLVLMPEKE